VGVWRRPPQVGGHSLDAAGDGTGKTPSHLVISQREAPLRGNGEGGVPMSRETPSRLGNWVADNYEVVDRMRITPARSVDRNLTVPVRGECGHVVGGEDLCLRVGQVAQQFTLRGLPVPAHDRLGDAPVALEVGPVELFG
jgi:hypothetical protein